MNFVEYNGQIYFTANNPEGNGIIYTTNGTSAGTNVYAPLKDVSNLFYLNNKLYITIKSKSELWSSDGTDNGASIVKKWNVKNGFEISNWNSLDSIAIFTANDSIHGLEIWRTNGTKAGTYLLNDIYPGSASSYFTRPTILKNEIYFWAKNGSGAAIYKTDGTISGTKLVKSEGYTYQYQSIVIGDYLYYLSDYNIYKSDGTADGTTRISSAFGYPQFANLNGVLYFTSSSALMYYDESSNSTKTVKSFPIPGDDCDMGPIYYDFALTKAGNNLYLRSVSDVGTELWVSDGTEIGTKILKDINPGPISSSPEGFTAIGNSLYFKAYNSIAGTQIWKTEGNESSTLQLTNLNTTTDHSGISEITLFNGKLLLNISGEIYSSNGTNQGTFKIGNSISDKIATTAEKVYFFSPERQLIETDGTIEGTDTISINMNINQLVVCRTTDCWDCTGPVSPIVTTNNSIYFIAYEMGNTALMCFNPSDKSLTQINSNNSYYGESFSYYGFLHVSIGNYLYYFVDKTLWKTDGTIEGTSSIKTFDNNPQVITTNDQGILFISFYDNNAAILWKSDVTNEGTMQINTEGLTSSINRIYTLKDKLLFNYGNKLFVTDGNNISEFYSHTPYLSLYYAAAITDDSILYTTADIYPKRSFLRTDGTKEGTWIIENVPMPNSLLAVKNKIFYTSDELYISNGTESGTRRIADIYPGKKGSDVSNLTLMGDYLYFTANTPEYGYELYRMNVKGLITEITPAKSETKQSYIFPNPATSDVYLQNQFKAERFELLNVAGVLIASGIVETSGRIDLSKVNSGVYLIKLFSKSDCITEKVIKY